jgi:hypothetical protein
MDSFEEGLTAEAYGESFLSHLEVTSWSPSSLISSREVNPLAGCRNRRG